VGIGASSFVQLGAEIFSPIFSAMAFSPYVEGILVFIQTTTADEDASADYLKTCYNLLGDLASTYQAALKPALLEPSISRVLNEAKNRGYKQRGVINAAKYARQASLAFGCWLTSKANRIHLCGNRQSRQPRLKRLSLFLYHHNARPPLPIPSLLHCFSILHSPPYIQPA
jgi:hypothetical protein